MSKFVAHGSVDLEVADNILFIYACGPWNSEFFTILHKKLYENIAEIDGSNFATYLKPIGEAIPLADAFEIHREFLKQTTTKAVAIDLSQCETKTLTKELCKNMYGQAKIEYAFFDDIGSATQWLNTFVQPN